LVQANDVKEAFENTVSTMKDTMGEYTIPAISESPIMDVFPYFSGEEEEMERVEAFTKLKNDIPVQNTVNEDAAMADSLTAEVE
jgi:hypothetical protein